MIHRLTGADGVETPDAQLLTRFTGQHDESAFAELVRRHAPMVLSVARRVLRDEHAAEDAFQVTFLTLACRARTVRRGQALAAWLHRVAYHVALRTQAKARRTIEVEQSATPPPRPDAVEQAEWHELAAILDDELQRLPARYRGPLVMCGLEGKTHEEAARDLGWPLGSVSKRLARGRDLLRQRLARRGFKLGSAALPALLIGEATAAVPEALLTATTRAAVQMEGFPATIAGLLKEVQRAMTMTHVRRVAVLILTVTLLASAVGLGLLTAGRAAPPQENRVERPGQPDEPKKPGAAVVALGQKKFRFRAAVGAIEYSPDGKLLVIAEHNTLHLFDAATRKELRSWDVPKNVPKDVAVKSVAFSPDSKSLATAGQYPHFHLWDVTNGKLIREFAGFERLTEGIAFSVDGKRLAMVGENLPSPKLIDREAEGPTVRIWETNTGKELKGMGTGLAQGTCVSYSPDGQLLIWGTADGAVHVHKVAGAEVFTYKGPEIPTSFTYSIAISPDSKLVAAGIGALIKLFDLRTGKLLKTMSEQFQRDIPSLLAGMRLHFSPDGKTLASVSSTSMFLLWDVASGKLDQKYLPRSGLNDLSFYHDGKTLATAGQDSVVRFWDLVKEQEETEGGHRGGVAPVALSPDDKTVVTACWSDGLRCWDRETGKELRMLPKFQAVVLGYGADGLVIIGVEDDRVHLYDASGKDKGTVGKAHNARSCLALSADGKLLAVGNEEIRVYDLATGKEKARLSGHGKVCLSLAFGPDGKTLLSAGEEPPVTTKELRFQFSLKLWDLNTGKEVRALPHPAEWGIKQVAYSADGKLAATNTHVWDVTTGKMVRELAFGVESPQFSPDGKLLALPYQYVVPKSKAWIELWDTTSWQKVGLLEGHGGMIAALSFSADGKFLVSGSEDTSARVWEIAKWKK
jgi:RNA polymerase sigma factor (sigma-70 family)